MGWFLFLVQNQSAVTRRSSVIAKSFSSLKGFKMTLHDASRLSPIEARDSRRAGSGPRYTGIIILSSMFNGGERSYP
jgi:hypothetical protein